MPFQTNGKRDYGRQLAWEHKRKPHYVKDRAQRNAARAAVAKKKRTTPKRIRGDIGHKTAISRGGGNSLANLFVQSAGSNRSFKRNKRGAMTSERSKRERGK